MLSKYLLKYVCLLVSVTAVSALTATAQDTSKVVLQPGYMSGKVVNLYSVPVANAKIAVSGTSDTASTNRNGVFTIKANTGSKLIIKAKGFNVTNYKIGKSKRPLIIQVGEAFLKQPDVINVLYDTVKASNNLSAISTIYNNQLTTTPASLYTYALPGRLAGLYTQQNSGFPSASTASAISITLAGPITNGINNLAANDNRGQFSLTARGKDQPVTIIDGVQRELSSIDPESIESISLLKDGLSTILLGVNSSNNVLLITTKRPQAGKTLISATGQYGLQQPLGLPTPLSSYQYAYLANEAQLNDGRAPIYSAADINAYKNQTDPYGHPDVNWFNTLLRKTAPLQSYKLNISGGNNVAKFIVGLNYFNQTGILKTDNSLPYNSNNGLNRYILNSDINLNATKNFNIDLQLFGRIQSLNYPGNPGSNISGILNSLYNTPNNAYPLLNQNGTFPGSRNFTTNLLSSAQYSGYTNTLNHDILTNLDLKYNLSSFVKGLSVRGKGNFAVSSENFIDRSRQNAVYQFVPASGNYTVFGSNQDQNNSFNLVSNSRYSYAQAALAYNNNFGKNNISSSLFYDFRSIVLSFDLPRTLQNRAFTASYDYDGKYLANAVINNSSDDRYPPGHRAHFFYAGGIGWQMGKEAFMKNLSWISSWKWRATYGNTGSGNIYGYFPYRAVYQGGGNGYPQGTSYAGGNGYTETNGIVNTIIDPERANKFDVGTDIGLFGQKFLLTADYYNDTYYDLLDKRGRTSQVAGIGDNFPLENLSKTRYEGAEVTLTYQSHVADFNYFITGNGNITQSKRLYFDELPQLYPWLVNTGRSVRGSLSRGFISEGIIQTQQEAQASPSVFSQRPVPGDMKYKDLTGDGNIDFNDLIPLYNQRPLIYYGLNFGFSYKGFNFSMLWQGVGNNQIMYNGNKAVTGFGGGVFSQVYESALNRWTPENAATATLPRLSSARNGMNYYASTFYLHSNNYIRLKNAEIGYTVPFRLTSRINVSSIRFFVNGLNLLTFSGFKGIDPEVNGDGVYPIQRVFNAGVNIKL